MKEATSEICNTKSSAIDRAFTKLEDSLHYLFKIYENSEDSLLRLQGAISPILKYESVTEPTLEDDAKEKLQAEAPGSAMEGALLAINEKAEQLIKRFGDLTGAINVINERVEL